MCYVLCVICYSGRARCVVLPSRACRAFTRGVSCLSPFLVWPGQRAMGAGGGVTTGFTGGGGGKGHGGGGVPSLACRNDSPRRTIGRSVHGPLLRCFFRCGVFVCVDIDRSGGPPGWRRSSLACSSLSALCLIDWLIDLLVGWLTSRCCRCRDAPLPPACFSLLSLACLIFCPLIGAVRTARRYAGSAERLYTPRLP